MILLSQNYKVIVRKISHRRNRRIQMEMKHKLKNKSLNKIDHLDSQYEVSDFLAQQKDEAQIFNTSTWTGNLSKNIYLHEARSIVLDRG